MSKEEPAVPSAEGAKAASDDNTPAADQPPTQPAVITPEFATPKKGKAGKRTSPAPKANTSATVIDTRSVTGAGAAGVGGGTLIAMIASAMPDGVGKNILIWLAPTASIIFSAVWIWVRNTIVSMREEWAAARSYKDTKKVIDDALANPHITDEDRARFQARSIELEQWYVDRKMAQAEKSIRPK